MKRLLQIVLRSGNHVIVETDDDTREIYDKMENQKYLEFTVTPGGQIQTNAGMINCLQDDFRIRCDDITLLIAKTPSQISIPTKPGIILKGQNIQ